MLAKKTNARFFSRLQQIIVLSDSDDSVVLVSDSEDYHTCH